MTYSVKKFTQRQLAGASGGSFEVGFAAMLQGEPQKLIAFAFDQSNNLVCVFDGSKDPPKK